jgi:hypothetical protein
MPGIALRRLSNTNFVSAKSNGCARDRIWFRQNQMGLAAVGFGFGKIKWVWPRSDLVSAKSNGCARDRIWFRQNQMSLPASAFGFGKTKWVCPRSDFVA